MQLVRSMDELVKDQNGNFPGGCCPIRLGEALFHVAIDSVHHATSKMYLLSQYNNFKYFLCCQLKRNFESHWLRGIVEIGCTLFWPVEFN